jgi:hypothetical protein
MAAAFYHLGDLEKMQTNWQTYLGKFKKRTNENLQDIETKALNWMMEINPYKDRSPINDFWEFISNKNSGIETKKCLPFKPKKQQEPF